MAHPALDVKNPNKVYSLIGGFLGGCPRTSTTPPAGYALLGMSCCSWTPSTAQAARAWWRGSRATRSTTKEASAMKAQLERIVNHEGLSENVYEIVAKSLE